MSWLSRGFAVVWLCILGLCAPLAQAAPFAYIANSGDGTVSVIDTATNTVVGAPIVVGVQPFSFGLFIGGAGPAPTTMTLVSSLNPSNLGQSVTFTATVTGTSPMGTVQFKDGASNLGAPVTLSGGVAPLTTSSLAVGTHPITAVYGGDVNNLGSTSNTVNQVVNAAAPPPSTSTPIPALGGWALALTALLLLLAGVLALARLKSR